MIASCQTHPKNSLQMSKKTGYGRFASGFQYIFFFFAHFNYRSIKSDVELKMISLWGIVS